MGIQVKTKPFSVAALILAVAMLVNMFSAVAFASSQDSQPSYFLTEADLLSASQPLLDAQSEFYSIVNKEVSNIVRTVQVDGTIDTTFDLKLSMVLKANSVSELPYMKGMLKKVGIATVEECTAAAIESKMAENTGITAFTDAAFVENRQLQAADLPKIMADVIATANTYEEYIGTTSDFWYNIKVTSDTDGDVLFVGALTFNDYMPLEIFFPQSEYEMMMNGAEAFETAVLSALEQ